MPGKDSTNVLTTSLLGIVGAAVGGFAATALRVGSVASFSLGGLIIAVLGAMAVLWIYRMVRASAI